MGMFKIAYAAAVAAAALVAESANAQVGLPEIDVTASRIVIAAPAGGGDSGTSGSATTAGAGIVGASTSVITREEIERSPAHDLPDILSREPGIQTQNLFGGVNGARSVIDMRGFGAGAPSNTLVLIDGRRISDLDLTGVDLAAIPLNSIERIEITRGNSGAVLYGDGAVGGVINILTRKGGGAPFAGSASGAVGSFRYRDTEASLRGAQGPWSASAFTNAINSDGYRVNNFYRQLNGVGDLRYTTAEGSAYLRLSADSQYIGLPGARRVNTSLGVNQLVTDPQGATTPYDHSQKDGFNATLGVTRMLAPGYEFILDGGVRTKHERAQYYSLTFDDPPQPLTDPRAAVDTVLTTYSLTPRLNINSALAGLPWKAIGGMDAYRAIYGSDRPLYLGAPPIDRYDLSQNTFAGYWQNTFTLLPTTDLTVGARAERVQVHARDKFDVNAPGGQSCFPGFGCFPANVQGLPLDTAEWDRAFNVGVEHRVNDVVALFGHWAQSFRVPNVDERVGAVTAQSGVPTDFNLRTQHSREWEAGVRLHAGPANLQWSYYDMMLTDEIFFSYLPNFEAKNYNLDPTRRYGHEVLASYRVSEAVMLKGGFAYTRSVFRSGLFAGNDVPLVSRWTANAGIAWTIIPDYLVFDGIVRYRGSRRMDNDQANLQPLIPAATTVDVKLSGKIRRLFWSASVQNLFDVHYFDYAIASPYPFGFASALGTYNAYPQPGRTYMLRAGATF